MIKGTAGNTLLQEPDIIDILRQHFARYGMGFKKINFAIDTVPGSGDPKFEIDLNLKPMNPKRKTGRPKAERIYHELMRLAAESPRAEEAIMNRVFELVQEKKLKPDEFIELVDKIKGQ